MLGVFFVSRLRMLRSTSPVVERLGEIAYLRRAAPSTAGRVLSDGRFEGAPMDARIRVLLRIIDERGGSLPMTSKEIGGLLGLGEARVLRLFSTEVGKTLRRYMLEVRMARASRMLMDVV